MSTATDTLKCEAPVCTAEEGTPLNPALEEYGVSVHDDDECHDSYTSAQVDYWAGEYYSTSRTLAPAYCTHGPACHLGEHCPTL